VHRRSLLICALAVTALLALVGCETDIANVAGSGDGAPIETPNGIDPTEPNVQATTQTIDFAAIRTVRIDLPTARVTLSQTSGENTASIAVREIIVKQGLSARAMEGLLLDSELIVEPSFVDEARLNVTARIADGLTPSEMVFDIRMNIPRSANVEVLIGNGPVAVSGLTGNLEIHTANGEVSLDNVVGNVNARTTNRPLTLLDVTGNIQAETSGADLTVRLAPAVDAVIALNNTDGAIRMRIAKTAAAALDLISTDGTVAAELAGFTVTDVTTSSGLLRATLNGGGGQIEAATSNEIIEFVGF